MSSQLPKPYMSNGQKTPKYLPPGTLARERVNVKKKAGLDQASIGKSTHGANVLPVEQHSVQHIRNFRRIEDGVSAHSLKLHYGGEYKTNEKIKVHGDVLNGSEKASVVQFFTSVDRSYEVANLQAISSRTTNKEFDIPVDAEGYYLVAKFTPMTEDGDIGEPRYVITENKVESSFQK